MLIEIEDRLYNDFVQWATANGMNDEDIHKYIIKAFKDRFMTDKYGDLNEKIVKQAYEPVKDETVIQNEIINEPISEPINEPIKRKTKIINSK